jgi:hypothetical protein
MGALRLARQLFLYHDRKHRLSVVLPSHVKEEVLSCEKLHLGNGCQAVLDFCSGELSKSRKFLGARLITRNF